MSTPRLARRHQQVLERIVVGATDEEIADDLGIAVHTVQRHVQNMSRALGASSRAHAAALAYQWQLVPTPGWAAARNTLLVELRSELVKLRELYRAAGHDRGADGLNEAVRVVSNRLADRAGA